MLIGLIENFLATSLIQCVESKTILQETINNEWSEERILQSDFLYFYTLTNIQFTEEKEKYKNSKTNPGIKNLLRTFEFLDFSDEDPLKFILYGADKIIPYDQIMQWVGKIFPFSKKAKGLVNIVHQACETIAKVRKTTEKIEQSVSDDDKSKIRWEDILLGFETRIIKLKTFVELFDIRNGIIEQLDDQIFKEMKKKPDLWYEIEKIQMEMQNYHMSEEKIDTLILRRHISKEFEDLIIQRENITKLVMEYNREKKEKIIKSKKEELVEVLERIFQEEEDNDETIKNKILETQSMTKILFVTKELADYFDKMSPQEFEKTFKNLKVEEIIGLSVIASIGNIVDKYLYKITKKNSYEYKLELTDKRYIMGNFMKKIEESKLESAKEILKSVDIMESDEKYNARREYFVEMLEKNKILEYDLKKNEEEKKED